MFTRRTHRTIILLTTAFWVLVIIAGFHAWLHFTNPYARANIVEQPYKTKVKDGQISLKKQFDLAVYDNPRADVLGYYKSGFLIVQNAWFGSPKSPSKDADGIISDIHRLRFDPSKPYLITGDQFSVLYPRNLGVFYNSVLNPHTAHSQKDWQNRQRIYLQSAAYAIEAFSAEQKITTTIVPISPKSAALTQVHPGSVASDSLYGVFYALDALSDEQKYPDAPYKLQTASATKQLIAERREDLKKLLDIYLRDVRDPTTGLIKKDVHLSSARDGSLRKSSFYDNVVMWKTLQLADKLGIESISDQELTSLRTKILETFWLPQDGHFKDDLSDKPAQENYSSDWLIALPTGFLSPESKKDLPYLQKSTQFIKKNKIDEPLPIKYTASSAHVDAPWAVKTFVPNYGGNAIWSYWGAEYISLLANLYEQTGNKAYEADAEKYVDIYNQKIEQTRGFPETFDAEGNFLETPVYKSIRQTGWVVQLEHAEWLLKQVD